MTNSLENKIVTPSADGADGWIVLAHWEWGGDRLTLHAVRTAKTGGPEGIYTGFDRGAVGCVREGV